MKIIKEIIPYIVIVVVVVLIRTFIITPVRVDGDSMKNTLKNGDILLLYKLGSINRLDEYAYGETSDYDKVTLEDDEYFILGDNRLISKDSRYFGPIKENEIKGKIVFRVFPFTKIGTVQ